MRRTFLLAILVFLGILCVWILQPDSKVIGEGRAIHESKGGSAATFPVTGNQITELRAETLATEVERQAEAPFSEFKDPTHTFQVKVFSPEDQSVEEGVEVYLIRNADLRLRWKRLFKEPLATGPLPITGETVEGPFFSNGNGIARTPHPNAADLLLGKDGERFGFVEPDGLQQQARLDLYWDPPIHIHLVDERGSPLPHREVGLLAGKSQPSVRLKATTDAHGNAVLHAPRLHLKNWKRTSFSLGLCSPGAMPQTESVPYNLIPRQATLVAPPESILQIDFLDPSGEPFLGQAVIEISAKVNRKWTVWHRILTPQDAGVLRIEGVPLQTELTLKFGFRTQYTLYREKVTVQSPSAPGEALRIEYEAPGTAVTLPFQLLDWDGEPVSGMNIQASVMAAENERQRFASRQVRVDGDGRGALSFHLPEQDLDLVLHVQGRRQNGERVTALLPLAPEHLTESPTVAYPQWNGPPIYAAGTVIDEHGDPAGNVDVWIVRTPTNYNSGITPWRMRTGPDGRFVIRKKDEGKSWKLQASWSGVEIDGPTVTPGEEGHLLQLPSTPFRIEGFISLPSYAGDQFSLSFVQGDQASKITPKKIPDGVSFEIAVATSEPGTLRLSHHRWETMATLDSVIPVPVGGKGDPRIVHWDLREAFPLAEIEVHIGGKEVKQYALHPIPKSTENQELGYYDLSVFTGKGRSILLVDGDPSRLLLSGQDLWDSEVEVVPGHQIIQGIPARRAIFKLSPDVELPSGVQYKIYGEPVEKDIFDSDDVRLLSKDGAFDEVNFHRPDQWKFYLNLTADEASMYSYKPRLKVAGVDEDPFLVDIPEGSGPFEVILPIDPADVRQKLERMGH
ncbi:MAG: carboxypeptidase-like regulatory domain-containing protein [Planctomycetota bacterium]